MYVAPHLQKSHYNFLPSWRQYKHTQFHAGSDHLTRTIPCLRVTLQFCTFRDNIKYTIWCLQRLHQAHNSALTKATWSTQFHACGSHYNSTLADHITIPCLWGHHKAHNSTLVETIQDTQFCACGSCYTSTLMETIQSTQFHACGDNTRHTIPEVNDFTFVNISGSNNPPDVWIILQE